MYRIIYIVIFAFLVNLFCTALSFAAWPWKDTGNLVDINGVSYTPDDFKRWWENWRDAGSRFPNDMEQFIEWKLLAQEAKSMELDQEPNYQRKIDVFHKVRTRILLKNDRLERIVCFERLDHRRHLDGFRPRTHEDGDLFA